MMKKPGQVLFIFLLTFATLLIIFLTLPYAIRKDNGGVTEISSVQLTVGGETKDALLPLTVKNLTRGTEVIVSFRLSAKEGDELFFGSVYAPLRIEVNGEKAYEYGKKGMFPPFFTDPPTQYDSVTLPAGDQTEVRMIYNSPAERKNLSIHAPAAGSEKAILNYLLSLHGVSMVLALFFILLGLFMMGLSVFWFCMNDFRSTELNFLSPGMLFVFSGAWQFGENSLSVFLLQSPALLYVLDFAGMFLLMIPLYKMGIRYLAQEANRLLNGYLYLLETAAFLALFLQLTGLVGLHRSLYCFHILLPLALVLLAVSALYEYLKKQNRMAGVFSVPFMILAVSALLELINYYVRFLPKYSVLFQAGLFFFVIAMAVFAMIYLQNMLITQINTLTLENEVKMQEQTITAQKVRNELLLSHFEEVRRQRHDIRHHLRTINNMLQQGETDKAAEYVRSLEDSVPGYMPETFCDNNIVSATLSFYAQKIREEGISLEIQTQVPAKNPDISDANLCVIFGNLLENAVEACQRMKSGERYIRLNSQVMGEVLFITMDNSYDGNVRMHGRKYYSSKRRGFGTGLSSVRSIAVNHNGEASFQGLENEFRSEVYVHL